MTTEILKKLQKNYKPFTQKVTKEQFLSTLRFNTDNKLSRQEMADNLGITVQQFYNLLHKYAEEITEMAKQCAGESQIDQIRNLERNAKKGDTRAAQTLLMIKQIYVPYSKMDVQGQVQVQYVIGNNLKVSENAGLSLEEEKPEDKLIEDKTEKEKVRIPEYEEIDYEEIE